MKAQTWIFIGLVIIVGFIFYKTGGDEKEVNPLKNKPTVDTADEVSDKAPGDSMDKEIPTEASGKNDTIENELKKNDDVIEEKKVGDAMEKEPEEITDDEPSGPAVQNIEGQTFTAYSNRAMGYDIQRPDNWYWQHEFSPEIENELEVIDILAINRSPLAENTQDLYESSIILDVIKKSPPTPKGSVSSLTITGKNTKRYESPSSIVYLLEVGNGNTIRFIYTFEEADEKERAIFENIVASFSL